MRPLQVLLPLLAWVSCGLAEGTGTATGLSAAVQHLPTCAQSCLKTALVESPCQITDTACVCTNTQLQTSVEGCVLQTCTLRQALTTKNLTATLCHAPPRYEGSSVRVSNIALAVITNVCTLARLIYKSVFSFGEFGWDDYTILAALISGVPSVIIIDRGIVPNGLGRDVWTVPFDHITNFVRWLYALEILYFLQVALIKLTLLFFFLRIFPKPLIRRLLWATVAFVCLFGSTFIVIAIFQCRPISAYWHRWDKQHAGKCININALAWSNAAISILLDIWMLAVPLYEIFHLQLSWRKKVSVTLMFCVGTFVTVVSALRLHSLVHFAVSSNPTWDQTEVIRWSNIEINVGIICACLPSLRVMLVRFFPAVFGTTKGSSQRTPFYGSRSMPGAKKSGAAAGSASAVGKTGQGKSGLSSALGKSGVRDSKAITYTQTFEVQHTESDEASLVRMEELGHGKGKGRGNSSTTSVSSM